MSVLAHAGAAAALTAALVSFAAAAYAQAPKGVSGPPSQWHFGVSADAMWYENARFQSPTNSSTWSTGGRANLDYSQRFQTGTFDLGAFGGTIYYPELDSFRQFTYGGRLGLSVTSSPRTQFTLGQSFVRTNTRLLTYDEPQDIPLPTTGVYYANSSLGLTHRMSQAWQLGLSGSFLVRRYDRPTLIGGEQLGAGLRLNRLLGRSGAVFVAYQFSNAWYEYADTLQSRVHQALVGGRYTPTKGIGFEVSGGAAYLEPADAVYPAGSARLSATGRKASLVLFYARDFGQAFGYGRQTIGDIWGARASWNPKTALSFFGSYTYGFRRAANDLDYQIRSEVATGGLGWGAAKGLSLSARYSWERNQTVGYPRVEGGRVVASISYGVEWR